MQKRIMLHVILPLVIGLLIYLFFRTNIWFLQLMGIREPVFTISTLNYIQKILIYSGPDFCWAYSFSSALFIWGIVQYKNSVGYSLLVFVLIILSELVQVYLYPQFTFDPIDLIAAFAGFLLSYFFLKYERI